MVSVITRISYDHTDILGNTLAEIAGEKAGIIKPDIPVFIGKRQTETDSVFFNTAKHKNSPVFFVEDNWKSNYKGNTIFEGIHDVYFNNEFIYPQLEVGLLGKYQAENVATVCAVADFLSNNQWDIKDIHLYRGLKNIQKNVNLMGRMQVISQNPLIIADIAHNSEGIQAVIENLSGFNAIHAVLGILQDKDAEMMIQLFPQNTVFYMITADTLRAIPAQELTRIALTFGYKAGVYSTLETALKEAEKNYINNDVIYTGGSNYVVSRILPLFIK
jgi:dihydrofolate synthase/folylpolyglutamate synthase